MKKNKIKKYETEEQAEVKKFILVLLGLIIVIVGIYFFTRAFVTKDLFKKTEDINYQTGVVDENAVIVGNMLNRPYDEYYVIAFNSEDTQVNYYNTLVSKYKSKSDAIKVYFLDLNNELNKEYIASDENITTSFKSIDELKLGKLTLIKVKKGKVTKMATTVDELIKELKLSE